MRFCRGRCALPLTNENLKAEFAKLGFQNAHFCFFPLTDSTNTRAREYAAAYGELTEPVLFVADGQSDGRGRRGRSFLSQKGVGLYMSALIPLGKEVREFDRLTAYAAVITAEVIEALSGIKLGIKWVNDLYRGGKKLAGILTEGIISPDTGKMEYAVIGIGINVLKTNFGEELSDIATDVETESGKMLSRAELAARIFKCLCEKLSLVGTRRIMRRYRARSLLRHGDEITVISAGREYSARFLGIERNAALKLKKENGELCRITSGEISVRRKLLP